MNIDKNCRNLISGENYLLLDQLIGLVGRVFTNGPGEQASVPGSVIPKTLKWYLIPPCLTLSNTRYVSKVKWSNPGKGVAPSPTPRCSSYEKGAFWSPSTTVASFTYYPSNKFLTPPR